jgi:hypothetical protein
MVGLAALVGVGVARADGPPAPPPSHPPRVLAPAQQLRLAGGELVLVPPEGGLYLDPPAWTYQVELRRYYEARIKAGEEVAERQFLRGALWGGAAGVALGLVVGGVRALAR